MDPSMNIQHPIEHFDSDLEDDIDFQDMHPSWINSQISKRIGFIVPERAITINPYEPRRYKKPVIIESPSKSDQKSNIDWHEFNKQVLAEDQHNVNYSTNNRD